MCGIVGIISLNDNNKKSLYKINDAISVLSKRGPDNNGIYINKNVALGHTRLSVIDTSDAASQPFTDVSGRYTIVFNGEIYNYKELKKDLIKKGIVFHSQSDTEVLLYLFISEGSSSVNKLNGAFAFAIYDKVREYLFIARDRMGIKPLLIYRDKEKFIFSSEMKALLAFDINKDIDNVSLYNYLQLNYIPTHNTIFKNVKRLKSGHYLEISNNFNTYKETEYYKIPYYENDITSYSYNNTKKEIIRILDDSVKKRLISDVPLGAFLSGGIDSSIIVALASKHTKHLNTFSIGFKDQPLFDETRYAQLVADKYKINHTRFILSNDDLFSVLYNVLEYIDEPFADSSALAVYILSKYTQKHVKVALSGDGADEMFGGYNKYMAEYKIRNKNTLSKLVKWTSPIWNNLPQSRNSNIENKIRQLSRFAKGVNLSEKQRYWLWCGLTDEKQAEKLLKLEFDKNEYIKRKNDITKNIKPNSNINDVLYSDMHLVLQNDMLTKVDMMSMANSLEVRVPFLDHELVNYVSSIPSNYKIDKSIRKKILKDAFKDYLPKEIYNRPKQGFEVPLLKWFRTELKPMIINELLDENFIIEQNIFNLDEINKLKKRLFSNNPKDIHAQIWGLIVFQYWWKKVIYKD